MENLIIYSLKYSHNVFPIIFKLFKILEFWYLDLFIKIKIICYLFVHEGEQILPRFQWRQRKISSLTGTMSLKNRSEYSWKKFPGRESTRQQPQPIITEHFTLLRNYVRLLLPLEYTLSSVSNFWSCLIL